jgi:hypothetical protein
VEAFSIISFIIGIVSLIIGAIALYYSIVTHKKNKFIEIRSNEVTQSTSESISNIAMLIKKTNDHKLSFELERNTRRLSLYTDDNSQIHSALFWFHEHGNLEDKLYIRRAINSNCFNDIKNLELAEDTIRKIKAKFRED